MSLYPNPTAGPVAGEEPVQKANQACMSCRKQKRKCDKALPACALCSRMNRHCDYSDSIPAPTHEDFNALRNKLMELEGRLNGRAAVMGQPTSFPTPSSSLSGPDGLGPQAPGFSPPQEAPWQNIQNRFPAIAFLDAESFTYGQVSVPKPPIDIPLDVLELLGDGPSVQATLIEYFSTIHKTFPIVSQKRLTQNMSNPLWEAGPDLALLFLCMKLAISKPQDGIESSQNLVYMAAKRFVALMEATGMVTLVVLQANLLVTLYEYGQAIYPAAWMSAGWCVRYGNLCGINEFKEAAQVLGRPQTWIDQEERRRTWWGVLVIDRIVSIGSQTHIMTSQEPNEGDPLPVDDAAWDEGEMGHAYQRSVGGDVTDTVAPFPRLCQAYIMLGKVFMNHKADNSPDTSKFSQASQLYLEISVLARKITEEAAQAADYLSFAAPMALTFSALCTICEVYSCPTSADISKTPEAAAMQVQALDGLKTVSRSIVDFAEKVNLATQHPQDLDRVSPLVMDALYSAAANNAWLVRENGDENSQMALESLRHCLRRLGARWRNAAEYLRILEAQEFTYAVGTAGSA
ncbi:fungal specific transcription factor-containing protein [Coleophoma cylindrospora]|uniref:Fungal specific transcription factor-containing protein n=1 Tax=Coleophoma cylindrospora TaxID=1849047 RepID=A0A3D8RGT0_9HELO|nr:fungal specific transcription factor-containing protein [Coleophoma cylindrospora]